MNMPAPKLVSSLPFVSNFKITGMFNISPVARSRQLLAPHRSATQIDLPSLSMSTALVEPHFRPSGNCPQPLMVRYGLGASFVGAGVSDCPQAHPIASTSTPRISFMMDLLDALHNPSFRTRWSIAPCHGCAADHGIVVLSCTSGTPARAHRKEHNSNGNRSILPDREPRRSARDQTADQQS